MLVTGVVDSCEVLQFFRLQDRSRMVKSFITIKKKYSCLYYGPVLVSARKYKCGEGRVMDKEVERKSSSLVDSEEDNQY